MLSLLVLLIGEGPEWLCAPFSYRNVQSAAAAVHREVEDMTCRSNSSSLKSVAAAAAAVKTGVQDVVPHSISANDKSATGAAVTREVLGVAPPSIYYPSSMLQTDHHPLSFQSIQLISKFAAAGCWCLQGGARRGPTLHESFLLHAPD